MAPAKTLGKGGAGWELHGEGMRINIMAFVLINRTD
jgi:hypothetical protein